MTDKQIALLCYVIRNGSITRAAKEMGVARSTLSREIALLEDEMQAPLFYRSQDGVIPTPVGEFLSNASFGNLVSRIAEDCRRMAEGGIPGLQLAMDMPGAILAQPVLDEMTAMRLDMPLEVYTYKNYSILNLLLSGDANAAIMQAEFARRERRLTCQHLCSPNWLVAAREDHPYWSLPKGDRAVLRRQVVIFDAQTISSRYGFSEPCSQYCTEFGLPVQRFLWANFFQDQMLMLQAGLGIALVPPFAAASIPPGIRLSDELEFPFAPEYALVYRPETRHLGVQVLSDLCTRKFGGASND